MSFSKLFILAFFGNASRVYKNNYYLRISNSGNFYLNLYI